MEQRNNNPVCAFSLQCFIGDHSFYLSTPSALLTWKITRVFMFPCGVWCCYPQNNALRVNWNLLQRLSPVRYINIVKSQGIKAFCCNGWISRFWKKMRTKNDMSGEAPEYLKESEGRIILKFFEKLKI